MREHETFYTVCANCETPFEQPGLEGKCPHCGQAYEIRPLPKTDKGKVAPRA